MKCSTHILDTTTGKPATGVEITLSTAAGTTLTGYTDTNGRYSFEDLAPEATGTTLTLRFAISSYFESQECLYPEICITINVAPDQSHYHIPLLLAPYGYSTYRGS